MSGKRIGVLGLAFKAGTNDVRTSLSVRIIDRLYNLGASIAMHDPVAMEEAQVLLPSIDPAMTPYAVAENADLIMLLTDWPEYLVLDWSRISKMLRSKVVFDGRNALNPAICVAAGLRYYRVGKATS